jgi:hypothetical protein
VGAQVAGDFSTVTWVGHGADAALLVNNIADA